ncbi:MAG: putative O-glycosylation ligase, exosortase A system-associated, partial [Gammaproteobacteria bacterium]|nr:putative O-glycosylation ligase, exosortase A system-associated [Gammaproteobacteria bacterium]
MRSLVLFFAIMIVTPSILILPHLGVLVWTWISIMNPHRLSWGFTDDIPFVLIIASVTLVAWLVSKEPKTPPSRLLMWVAFAFVIQMTVSSITALHPTTTWLLWENTLKTFALFFFAATVIRTKVRIQALLWIIAISLGFYATRGVMNTLTSGGKTVLVGPAMSMLADNNHLALSLVMLLPILNYLRITSTNKLVRSVLIVVLIFTIVSVITSYSRGALIALAVAAFALMKSGKGR